MNLNLLLAETISKRFYVIVKEVSKMRKKSLLKNFFSFVERQWIKHSIWPPTSWSVFMQHRQKKTMQKVLHYYSINKFENKKKLFNLRVPVYHKSQKNRKLYYNENLWEYGLSIKTEPYPLRSCYVNWPSSEGNNLRKPGRNLKTPKVKKMNRNCNRTVWNV